MKGLFEHLQKAEIEFIATHGGGYPETFKWDKDILAHARRIGFKVSPRVDDIDGNKWVRTTSNIDICLTDGFVNKGG